MVCLRENDEGADLLVGYLENTLDAARRIELEQHAQVCAECRGLLEVQQTLGDFPVPDVSLDFDTRLYARIAEEEQKRKDVWWRKLLWRPMVPLVAAASVVAVGLYVRVADAPSVDETTKAAITPVEMQQIEQALEDLELLMPLPDSL